MRSIHLCFFFNTGATDNLVGKLDRLKKVRELNSNVKIIEASDELTLNATHSGEITILVRNLDDKIYELELTEVLYVPNLGLNLISKDYLAQRGFTVFINSCFADIRIDKQSVCGTHRMDRVKYIKFLILENVLAFE